MNYIKTAILIVTAFGLNTCSWMSSLLFKNDTNQPIIISYIVKNDSRGIDMTKVRIHSDDSSSLTIDMSTDNRYHFELLPDQSANIGWTASSNFSLYRNTCSNYNLGVANQCIPVDTFRFILETDTIPFRTEDLNLVE